MRLIKSLSASRCRGRLRADDGFAVVIAVGVLAVTALLVAAVWVAVGGDAHLTARDLAAKRALYAAQAGENQYVFNLNQSPAIYWQSCAHDSQTTPTAVPGSTTGEYYSYRLIPANGNASCIDNNTNSIIDTSTGTIRIEFTGYSSAPGAQCVSYPTNWPVGCPEVRTAVTSFREKSPFEFIWYTVYEERDPVISGTNCAVFYRDGNNSPACNINWISQDTVNGPMYTEDQYLINGSPTFGRNQTDRIESMAPNSICSSGCGALNLRGTAVPNAGAINPPSDNSFLATDATNFGKVFSGTTSITVSGTTANVTNCPSSCTTTSVDITKFPVIYVANGGGCTPAQYSTIVGDNYPTSGCTGDVYVSGSYSAPLTIGAANNIIIDNNLTDTSTDGSGNPSGTASLGLVANQFVRVMHGVSGCSSGGGGTNVPGHTFSTLTIHAAILAIQHSFMVDNYMCGSPMSTLNLRGALAQYFRGAVGTSSSGSVRSGYAKNYAYDDRLQYLVPPYLFDISNAGWHPSRQTLCTPARNPDGSLVTGADPKAACANPAP